MVILTKNIKEYGDKIEDILSDQAKQKYHIEIKPSSGLPEDEIHLGYFKLDKL